MTTAYIKDIPEEIAKHIIKKQADFKLEKGIEQVSISQTIIRIIKKHQELTEIKKK